MPTQLRGLVLLPLLAAAPLSAQERKEPKPPVPAVGLATAGLAGQTVAVLPLTMVVSDPRIPGGTGARARAGFLRWADSLLADALLERATEVKWILPPRPPPARSSSGPPKGSGSSPPTSGGSRSGRPGSCRAPTRWARR